MSLLPTIRKPSAAWLWGMTSVLLLTLVPGLRAQTALLARTNISLSGDVLVDSFDSGDPTYSTNGLYTPYRRKDGGNLVLTENRTNAVITLSASTSGTPVKVYGRAYIGNMSQVTNLGLSTLGSTSWVDSTNFGIESGWVTEYPGLDLPDAPTPPTGGLPFPLRTVISFQGTNYLNSYLLGFSSSGGYNYQVGNLQLTSDQKILIQGNVKLYVTGSFKMSGPSLVIIGTNSSLTFYAGGSVDLSGGGVVNRTGNATNLTVNGLSTCTSIHYAGGSDFVGTIYAPYAEFHLSGGGSTIYNFTGSAVAKSIIIAGRYQVHCDEALTLLSTAATLSSPSLGASGLLQFNVAGVFTGDYAIESSTNLSDWSSVYTNSSPFTFTNTETGSEQRFFRAVYLP